MTLGVKRKIRDPRIDRQEKEEEEEEKNASSTETERRKENRLGLHCHSVLLMPIIGLGEVNFRQLSFEKPLCLARFYSPLEWLPPIEASDEESKSVVAVDSQETH